MTSKLYSNKNAHFLTLLLFFARTPTNGFETVPLKQPLPPGPIHSTDASQKPYGSRGQLAPPAPHHGSGRFPSQHEQTIGSNQSSPYASISRYSQNQGQQHGGGAGYRSKSPPQPPSRPSQQQHRQYQTQHSKQSQFTAVWSTESSKSSTHPFIIYLTFVFYTFLQQLLLPGLL